MKEATSWQDFNMYNYIFSNEVKNMSHYHIYHGAKVVFIKTFLDAALVWWLSTNTVELKGDYKRKHEHFFSPRVAFLISTKELRFVLVVVKEP